MRWKWKCGFISHHLVWKDGNQPVLRPKFLLAWSKLQTSSQACASLSLMEPSRMWKEAGLETKDSAGRGVNWSNLLGGPLGIRIITLGNALPSDSQCLKQNNNTWTHTKICLQRCSTWHCYCSDQQPNIWVALVKLWYSHTIGCQVAVRNMSWKRICRREKMVMIAV